MHSPLEDFDLHVAIGKAVSSSYCKDEDIGPDWQNKVNNLLQKHYGLSLLKEFQKEDLESLVVSPRLSFSCSNRIRYYPSHFSFSSIISLPVKYDF